MIDTEAIALTLGAFTAFFLGYGLAYIQTRSQISAYIQGQEDTNRRICEQSRATGGPCWVKSQLPPT